MRSLLIVTPDSADALTRAANSGADALIIDLAGAERDSWNRAIAFLGGPRAGPLYLRINPLAHGNAGTELDTIVPLHPDGIVLAGAEGGPDVTRLAAMLRPREAIAGMADGAIAIMAMVTDTPGALFGLGSYGGASRRLAALVLDADHLAAALGAEDTRDMARLARSLTLAGAAAAGVAAIDGPFRDIGDLAGLEAAATTARREGFAARIAIDAEQVPVINRAFSRPAPSRR